MHLRRDGEEPAPQPVTIPTARPHPGAITDRRRAERHSVLLSARVDIGGALLDCVVMDASPRGVRVRFGAPVALPEHVGLIMRDGLRREARRCWSRGTQVGLEFAGAAGAQINNLVARRARSLMERVQASDPATWLPALRAERYFGDAAVKEAAEAAEVAYLRLIAALTRHAGSGP